MIAYIEYAGGLHWSELEGPTDIVLIAEQDWFIIQDCQIQRLQMNIEYWCMHAQIVPMTLKTKNVFH